MKPIDSSHAHLFSFWRPVALSLVASMSLLSGCAPLVVGGLVGGSISVAADRRTAGTQIEDQTIEIKARARIHDIIGDRKTVSVLSYNRVLLLAGNVGTDQDKSAIEQAVARIPAVRSVVNELTVGIGFSSNFDDAIVTTKIKATFVDAKDLQVNAFKIHTDQGVVYLMGRVTEREANRATELARGVKGVRKVVRAFEIVTDAELVEMLPGRVPGHSASTP
ncbi:MAG: BON domain-containing protein [Burkholderiales bacterium]|jgi:osmotically-inducible protein OsmY